MKASTTFAYPTHRPYPDACAYFHPLFVRQAASGASPPLATARAAPIDAKSTTRVFFDDHAVAFIGGTFSVFSVICVRFVRHAQGRGAVRCAGAGAGAVLFSISLCLCLVYFASVFACVVSSGRAWEG